ncbi:MAG: carbohydrate kinase [Desulfobacterales bacterium]|nr:carbohydrate kinase [Desulfobacterales bacterium]
MSNKDLILSIDNGTQSLKSMIFDLEGQILAKEQFFFNPYVSKNPGWAEQDPETFWAALCQTCNRIWEKGDIDKDRIAGVAVTTQRGTVINVDHNGKPLRPAILWLDQRKTYGQLPVGGLWGLLFKIIRMSDTISFFQKEAEANWIRTYQPELWKNTHKFLLLSGYLSYRLTGEFVDSVGCQVGYIPFDHKRFKWASDWSWKWNVVPIDKNLLPDLHIPGQILGHITHKASGETGIPAGLPLIASAADKACEVIGSGSLDNSIGCLSYGTTATINVTSRKYIEAIPFLPPYPSSIPGYHTIEVQIYRGYWMVSWFKEEFGYQEQKEAEKMGIDPEVLFDKIVNDIPPGSMGLVLHPYWSPGLKLPGPEAKGSIIGFGDVHTRAHIYRSILEGLAYALREGKERIEKKTNVQVSSLRISGGGSQSESAMQITADIFGLPTSRPHIYETSGLGAAINVAVGLGLYNDYESAVKSMTHIGDVFEPDLKNHEIYNDLYNDIYKKMYRRLKPFYERIREITGYPK